MRSFPTHPQGILFDLDGTLLDSAADLYQALCQLCREEAAFAPPYAQVREVVSRGARAILRCAFPQASEEALMARLPHYLALYEAAMAVHTHPFEGIDALLTQIEAQSLRWGIVTNKPGYLTAELVQRIGWAPRAAAVVAGDTLPQKKPDPAPVLLACAQAGIEPAQSIFVGDDARDVQAGRAAGLFTVAVRWGYLDGGDPADWGADRVIAHPSELARWLANEVLA